MGEGGFTQPSTLSLGPQLSKGYCGDRLTLSFTKPLQGLHPLSIDQVLKYQGGNVWGFGPRVPSGQPSWAAALGPSQPSWAPEEERGAPGGLSPVLKSEVHGQHMETISLIPGPISAGGCGASSAPCLSMS